jgi:hypothetical protein
LISFEARLTFENKSLRKIVNNYAFEIRLLHFINTIIVTVAFSNNSNMDLTFSLFN